MPCLFKSILDSSIKPTSKDFPVAVFQQNSFKINLNKCLCFVKAKFCFVGAFCSSTSKQIHSLKLDDTQ